MTRAPAARASSGDPSCDPLSATSTSASTPAARQASIALPTQVPTVLASSRQGMRTVSSTAAGSSCAATRMRWTVRFAWRPGQESGRCSNAGRCRQRAAPRPRRRALRRVAPAGWNVALHADVRQRQVGCPAQHRRRVRLPVPGEDLGVRASHVPFSTLAGVLRGGARPGHPAVRGEVPPGARRGARAVRRSEEHTSELQSRSDLVCRLLLEKKKKIRQSILYYQKKKKKTI